MKSLIPLLFLVTAVANLMAQPAAGPAGVLLHVDDPATMLPTDPPAMPVIEATLTRFEKISGPRIVVQFHPKSPSPAEDAKAGVYMKGLATRLGTVKTGVLVVYFGDEDDWRIWIGDDLASRFVSQPGTAQQLTRNGAIHDTKEALLTAAHIDAEDALSALKKTFPANQPPSAAQRVKLQTDALLSHLMEKFGPNSIRGL